jgi:hypothetical protein
MHHWLHVALNSGHPALGFLHDAVEDEYLPRIILRWWPALDAITRRDGEVYADYIERVSRSPAATRVKICDLRHNLSRSGGPSASLAARYRRALDRLCSAAS